MSNLKGKSNQIEGKTDARIEAFGLTGLGTFAGPILQSLAGAILKEHGPAMFAAISRGLKGEESLFVQVCASWKEGDHYFIALRFKNV